MKFWIVILLAGDIVYPHSFEPRSAWCFTLKSEARSYAQDQIKYQEASGYILVGSDIGQCVGGKVKDDSESNGPRYRLPDRANQRKGSA